MIIIFLKIKLWKTGKQICLSQLEQGKGGGKKGLGENNNSQPRLWSPGKDDLITPATKQMRLRRFHFKGKSANFESTINASLGCEYSK